ncbi:amino acid/amide ABC transporter membrane protein 2 (HAAT family) /amino acid/amide ABC transporter ATP-binding protein 1 (HAAT family) [Blastococcus colisei]|uniref:Amino acid/amide ABC transporter membrane protein 2 (HAAT family) /amino acid/amide ABC transporter ATP-binding protein 1 (HAAT family) n=1 Tax=Blastococcus colisei TaxID=1564162 RepID=A0A543PA95_9ACTN|nr:branched-chain amino acid ABC transporter ATP-binding protein/permease [Blastococcus colisei]TQN40989.1 amino acid/amide ABC transporter membrane protein 2 (HAAT family) /amino acid/amide ABC transporter ATP-binding protein 1 (HAAT family) [Blastococcus colisei]
MTDHPGTPVDRPAEPGRGSLVATLIGRGRGAASTRHTGGRLPSTRSDALQALALVVLVCLFLSWGLLGSLSTNQLAIDIAMFVALAYAFNVISGFTGYISFGQVVFFGLGAFATALLIIHLDVPWFLATLLGGAGAALLAVPIGAVMLRLQGIYFALGMFGLAYIVHLLLSQWDFTGGSTGLVVPGVIAQKPVLLGVTGVAVAAFAVNAFMARSSFGLRAMAVRDDEQVAAAMGVPTTRIKVLAFLLSAVFPAVVGGMVAYNRGFIDTSSVFNPAIDLQVIVLVLAGGIGTLWGPLIGAVLLTVVSDQLADSFPDYQLALFGLLVILVTILLPGGIVSVVNRWGWLRRAIVRGTADLPATTDLERELAAAHTPRADRRDGEELLVCTDVGVTFGGVQALRGVDFTVRRGETVFIIGANGAGKTTLFNAITGVVTPSSGSVVFDGRPVHKVPAHQLARRGLARTFQIPRPFASMTVWENVYLAALGGRHRRQAREQAAWVVRVLGLEEIRFAASDTLAVGHRRMVELGRALALGPSLILLDEVMAGMSDDELERVRDAIRRMPAFGVDAVAGIEHVIKAIVDLADEIVVMDRGARIISGEPNEILRHPEVIRAYLGTGGGLDAAAPAARDVQ